MSTDAPLHLGILAHSMEGAALCLRTFCRAGFARMGEHHHPDVSLDCIAMGHSMRAWDDGDHDAIRETLALSADRLAQAGAEFFVCPDNTAHMALERPGVELALPGLHIAEVVADEAAGLGYSRVGVLGTRYLMDGPVYRRAFAVRGMDAVVPGDADRAFVNATIFGELVAGDFTDAARKTFVRVIEDLRSSGCDAVALVCTEIPLLVGPDESPLPTLDSTRLLARAASDVSVGDRPRPTWRGGPIG